MSAKPGTAFHADRFSREKIFHTGAALTVFLSRGGFAFESLCENIFINYRRHFNDIFACMITPDENFVTQPMADSFAQKRPAVHGQALFVKLACNRRGRLPADIFIKNSAYERRGFGVNFKPAVNLFITQRDGVTDEITLVTALFQTALALAGQLFRKVFINV